jgi:hypothetical protein
MMVGLSASTSPSVFAEMKNFFAEMQIARVFLNGNSLYSTISQRTLRAFSSPLFASE